MTTWTGGRRRLVDIKNLDSRFFNDGKKDSKKPKVQMDCKQIPIKNFILDNGYALKFQSFKLQEKINFVEFKTNLLRNISL